MTLSQMIQYLRLNVNVQDPENPSVIDPKFLAMTDADLELFVNVALAQNYFRPL